MSKPNEVYRETQRVKQLDKRRGGYFYFKIPATLVESFENKRFTRFICTMDGKTEFRCGLNHLGDGNFFIIVSASNLKKIGKALNDKVTFELKEDPNPLGVEMPEVMQVLLDQDEHVKSKFEKLSMGKKRHIIHTIKKIKDIDKQVHKALELIESNN